LEKEPYKEGESIMKTKTIIILIALTLSLMLFTANGFANIPAPPVNQSVGIADSVLNNMVEADCRACHGNNSVDPTSIPDRHHLLYSSSIIRGECQNSGIECLTDADCAPLEACTGETAASNPLENEDVYACLSCHDESNDGGVINFLVERDCLVCHVQVPGEASVHHLTGTAQGTDSPLGDPLIGDCTPCHGTLVDDYGDNAIIPTYAPSLVTPTVREGTADEMNIEGNRAGGCVYCHTSGTGSSYLPGTDSETGIDVYNSGTLHHTAGVDENRYGDPVNGGCELCHGNPITLGGDTLALRNCEQCHGYESLHNIQADSPNTANLGEIVVGGEDYGYGHIGIDAGKNNSDCWGCHGFGFNATAAPATGPVTPTLSGSNKQVIVTGTNTRITLNGSSLTNYSETTKYESIFTLTSQDGSITVLTPEQITNRSAILFIPGLQLPAGNYQLRAVKGSGATWVWSNPVSISIKEPLVIESQTMEASCGECSGELTVRGSGFGIAPPEGSGEFINVTQNGIPLDITTWNDWSIKATGAVCDGSEITVNGLFGSATK
jgi:hypothetical protein